MADTQNSVAETIVTSVPEAGPVKDAIAPAAVSSPATITTGDITSVENKSADGAVIAAEAPAITAKEATVSAPQLTATANAEPVVQAGNDATQIEKLTARVEQLEAKVEANIANNAAAKIENVNTVTIPSTTLVNCNVKESTATPALSF